MAHFMYANSSNAFVFNPFALWLREGRVRVCARAPFIVHMISI